MNARRLLGLIALSSALLAAACGQPAEPTPVPTPEPTAVPTPVPTVSEPTPTPEPADDRPLVDVSHLLDFVREGIYKNSDGVGGAAWLDYDRDGFLDLYITNTREAKNALFHNNGDGTFTNVADEAGVTSETGNTAVVAGDIDNDGCTDLLMSGDGGFIGDEPSSFKVYRNDCDGAFMDITESIGLDALSESYSWAIALADIDNDSDLDLFVGGPPGPGFDFGPPNRLFLNGGDGVFTDISASAGVIDDLPTCGVGFNDYDEDGFIDIFLATCVWLDARFRLLRNNGDLTFSDVSFESGLSIAIEGLPGQAEHDFRFGVTFSDYDSDGDLDILSRNFGANGWIFERELYTKVTNFPRYSPAFNSRRNRQSSRFFGGVFKIIRATFSGVSSIGSGMVNLTGRPRCFLRLGMSVLLQSRYEIGLVSVPLQAVAVGTE